MPYRDLRGFLEGLAKEGELLVVEKELSSRFELSAALKRVHNGPAVLFTNVKEYPGKRIAANVLGTRRRVASLLGLPEEGFTQAFIDRKEQRIPPRRVAGGPVKEVVLKNPADLISLMPAPVFHEKDAGPYLTAAITIARDPRTGMQNMGLHRIQLKGGNRLGILLANPPVASFWQKAEAAGRALEVAIAIGADPAVMLGAMVKATADGPDKFAAAGGMKGEAIELTPAETVDLLVPARAEVILEGRVLPHVREREGPFGESTGHYFEFQNPVIEIKAVTHRQDFLFQVLQVWGDEPDLLLTLGAGYEYFNLLKKMVPALVDLSFAPGTCIFNAVASVHNAAPAEVRRLMALILAMDQRIKQIVVVDDDVNIFEMREVQWALATRFQADRDLLLLPRLKGYVIDPSVGEDGFTAKLGLDATKKGQDLSRFEKISVPPASLARAMEALKGG